MMRWDRVLMWIAFYLVILGAALCVSGAITFRLTATTNLTVVQKGVLFCVMTGIFMSPFLLKCPPDFINRTICNSLLYLAYFGFVCLFLFFCFMFVRDGIWLVCRWLGYGPLLVEPMAVMKANISLGVIVLILAIFSLWAGVRVPGIREVKIVSDKIKTPLSVVVMSDIHLSRMVARNKIQGIVKKVQAIQPDLILLPGDIIDDEVEFVGDLVEELKELKAPLGVYVTDGNHEIYQNRKKIHQEFKKMGFQYLENEGKQVRPDIWVAGVPDIQIKRLGKKVEFQKALVEGKGYSILLAHTPKMFDSPENTAELQVSGHTHGGQIFPFHILSWVSNKYLAGLYHQGNRAIYVSRGAGQWGPQMRLFAPSEISVIKIYPASADFK